MLQKFFQKRTEQSADAREVRNWYEDRYQTVYVQRNLLVLMLLVALVGVFFSVIAVMKISTSKTLEPFIIQVEDKTGITNVVRPFERGNYSEEDKEALRKYFIMKYLNARETYSAYDYEYNYFTVVRMFSAGDVYYGFRRSVSSDNPLSPVSFGNKLQRTLKVRSITFLPQPPKDPKNPTASIPMTAQVRFVLLETGARNSETHRIATINFDFFDMKMSAEERYINPLGFQVLGYRVDEEVVSGGAGG